MCKRDSLPMVDFRLLFWFTLSFYHDMIFWSSTVFGPEFKIPHIGQDRMFRKYIKIGTLVFAALLALTDFRISAQPKGEILVSAAISLKNAFEEIGSIYEKQTGVRVRFNLGASGWLQKQIEAGAPVDIFASAGEKQMDDLQAQGLLEIQTRRHFARNILVLVIPEGSKLPLQAFKDLVRPEVTKIAIGNPKTVPAGAYAREALRNLKLWDALQSRFVLAENVRQVLDYVSRGETEAGIVYASDISAAHGKALLAAYAPEGSYSSILYPIAAIKGTAQARDARRFIDLTLSKTGQSILAKYGFLGPR
jgi:molybdate transport system substrate-binding protein